MGEPFADFVGITVPHVEWSALRSEVECEFEGLGMSVERDENRAVLWRSADGHGTVKADRRAQVWAMGVSGSVCAGLRVARRFQSFLHAVGARPHRVTRLDATLDLVEDAAPVVARIAAAGRRGELQLTRKRIRPADVETHLGLRVDGVESGTVYCGPKHADARMVVYDKRHERLRRKLCDVGDLTRYELRLKSGLGISLRDCDRPGPVFWHFASPGFLPAPEVREAWVPSALGFECEKVEPLTPFRRMLSLIDASPDVGKLLSLADQVGPYGLRLLLKRIEERASGQGVQGLAPAETACSAICGPPGGSGAGVSPLDPA